MTLVWIDPEIAGYVHGPGGRTWFRQNGQQQAGPAIVGISGGPGMSHHYLMPLTAFSYRHPVVLYDQLDTGNSDRPGDKSHWTVENFVDEIERVRASRNLEALILAGHSWGGVLAVEYALKFPSRTAGLILISPLLDTKRWIADVQELISELPEYVQKLIAEGEAKENFTDPGYLHANDIFKSIYGRRKTPKPPHHLRSNELFNEALYSHMWGPSEFTVRGVMQSYGCLDRLGQIAQPVQFVCGEYDEARPDTLREFAAIMPDAIVSVIPDVAHSAFTEDEAAFLSAVQNFLNARFH